MKSAHSRGGESSEAVSGEAATGVGSRRLGVSEETRLGSGCERSQGCWLHAGGRPASSRCPSARSAWRCATENLNISKWVKSSHFFISVSANSRRPSATFRKIPNLTLSTLFICFEAPRNIFCVTGRCRNDPYGALKSK